MDAFQEAASLDSKLFQIGDFCFMYENALKQENTLAVSGLAEPSCPVKNSSLLSK